MSHNYPMFMHHITTPLGTIRVTANEHALYALEFIENNILPTLISKRTQPINSIEHELALYFAGTLQKFQTPIALVGSPFQIAAWQTLQTIPYGTTMSYKDEAINLGNPTACRAVGNANGANKLAIIIPCHRVVQSNGNLGGYAAGLERKQWLINHEKKYLAQKK